MEKKEGGVLGRRTWSARGGRGAGVWAERRRGGAAAHSARSGGETLEKPREQQASKKTQGRGVLRSARAPPWPSPEHVVREGRKWLPHAGMGQGERGGACVLETRRGVPKERKEEEGEKE